MSSRMAFDYLILGGGLAGSVLACRLAAANPDSSIAILEAGQDESENPLCVAPLQCFGLHHTAVDWAYTTTPQKQLNGRLIYLGAGRALGGSTVMNYGLWTRGAKADYDAWTEMLHGDDSWGYDRLLRYFKRTERYFDTSRPDVHGIEGLIQTASVTSSSPKRIYGLRDAVRTALTDVGLRQVDDSSAGLPIGFSERVENWREGKRQIASNAYGLKSFQNVTVMTGQVVKRIVINTLVDGSKVAVGAETVDGIVYGAHKEVVVSCGALRSPQILLLSGIGPVQELSRHGIEQHVNLPVGLHFHDHLSLNQFWALSQPERGLSLGTQLWRDEPAYQLGLPGDWLAWTTGASLHEVSAAQRSDENNGRISTDIPEQLAWARGAMTSQDRARIEFFVSYSPAGARFQGSNLIPDGTHITTCTIHVLPTSRGTISLASANPTDMPRIDPNYYATTADRVTLRAGVRQAMRCAMTIKNSDGSAAVIAESPPPGIAPLNMDSSDEEIDERVKKCSQTLYHPGGGCGLGSVVDSQCKVKGVQGLRVADASIIPAPISAHYQVAVYAIAEKAADMIARDFEKR